MACILAAAMADGWSMLGKFERGSPKTISAAFRDVRTPQDQDAAGRCAARLPEDAMGAAARAVDAEFRGKTAKVATATDVQRRATRPDGVTFTSECLHCDIGDLIEEYHEDGQPDLSQMTSICYE